MDSWPEHLSRNNGALTAEQQQRLQASHVFIIGCGGLGGFVIEELVRIGVGALTIFDPDVFEFSNCNRQINALTTTMKQNKAEVAAVRAANIHPLNTVIPYPFDFREVPGFDTAIADAVVDCLDSVEVRLELARQCSRSRTSLVHGAVDGWYGQVGVQKDDNDLMARLYPLQDKKKTSKQVPSVLPFTVAVIASLQAAEVVKLLLDLPSTLHNTWMQVDLRHCDFELMT